MATGDKLVNLDDLKVVNDNFRTNLVNVKTTQPTSTDNRIWVKPTGEEYTVPTEAEFQACQGNFAPTFAEATANDPGTYVIYEDGKFYYLPNGHEANATWANTTKTLVTAGSELSELKSAITDIDAEIYKDAEITLSDLSFTVGKYINISGTIQDGSNQFRISDFIEVSAGTEIQYSLYGYNNVICVIAAYNGNVFVQSASVFYSSSASSGVGYRYTGVYTVPEGVTKIRIGEYNTTEIPSDTLSIPYKVGLPTENEIRIAELETIIDAAGLESPWKDKLWVCFGTSLTDNWSPNAHIGDTDEPTGKYPPYLQAMGKFAPFPNPHPNQPDITKSNNLGIAGGRISGQVLYYIRYYLHDNPNGASYIPNNADLITIEGSVNDYAGAVPLGQVGDTVPYNGGQGSMLPDATSEGTFAGACFCAFTEAMQYAPRATVVYLTDSTGKSSSGNNFGWERKNSLGLSQIDYINMAKAVAAYVGIPVIDCGKDSMINAANPDYLADWIHHSYLGGYQYAQTIWAKLKDIPKKALTVPN